ncbi:hypothetical protein LTR62_000011 [Meristemomyces frigidus]|uniref:Uncharacterized protein n=1 Tax=Meristemomyces frigidus TaxID=1508187 RepID=A0AAN7TQ40_9PEZI|nr:hypothetical protein LTR62_000011 [Meristemomyces frigidus]
MHMTSLNFHSEPDLTVIVPGSVPANMAVGYEREMRKATQATSLNHLSVPDLPVVVPGSVPATMAVGYEKEMTATQATSLDFLPMPALPVMVPGRLPASMAVGNERETKHAKHDSAEIVSTANAAAGPSHQPAPMTVEAQKPPGYILAVKMLVEELGYSKGDAEKMAEEEMIKRRLILKGWARAAIEGWVALQSVPPWRSPWTKTNRGRTITPRPQTPRPLRTVREREVDERVVREALRAPPRT